MRDWPTRRSWRAAAVITVAGAAGAAVGAAATDGRGLALQVVGGVCGSLVSLGAVSALGLALLTLRAPRDLAGRGRPDTPIDPSSPSAMSLERPGPSVEDAVVIADQARICRDLIVGLVPRQRAVLKLRLELGLEPEEIRRELGLTRRQYKRLAKDGSNAIADRVAALADGTWAARQRRLLAACLAGVASDEQRSEATRRLVSDPHTAALAREMRANLRRAGSPINEPPRRPAPSRRRLPRPGADNAATTARQPGSGLEARRSVAP